MRPFLAVLGLFSFLIGSARAQWEIIESHTTVDLRGVAYVGSGTAWVSGTNGTVLRTEDDGFLWQHCTTPPGAEHLDFRGIQAFDNNTAIVMSSGKGDLSRLYKTTDGCQTWTLLLTNPDKDGFWDALQLQAERSPVRTEKPTYSGVLLGDPVNGRFTEFETHDNGEHWARQVPGQAGTAEAHTAESIFAASNSSLLLGPGGGEIFVTGGRPGARSVLLSEYVKHDPRVSWKYLGGSIPLASGDSAGAFSLAIARSDDNGANTSADDRWTLLWAPKGTLVAVGGDYKKPNVATGTAAFSTDSGLHWLPATTPPHGYRSAVTYDPRSRTWIAVGPNGTDISTDDGRNWRPLKPAPNDPPDADEHWNALSLPFVVGPHGRIGRLEANRLTHP